MKKKKEENRTLMGTKQLAEYLDCCDFTIRKLIKNGLPHIKLGKVYRFHEAEILRWLKKFGDKLHD
jgi:excisionase family DNA binding protein